MTILRENARELLFASGNPHKTREMADMLGEAFRIRDLRDLGICADIPEEGATLEENALIKARYLFERFRTPCFADDTGLEVTALDGAPGVHSARYAGAVGDAGALSEANVRKLLTALHGEIHREARFRTVIAFLDGRREWLFEGVVNGTVTLEKRGARGFGYDSVFMPDGDVRTYAEMSMIEKNGNSHRARALQKFLDFLRR